MARQKNDGKGRLGGRKKGTPNKVTQSMRTWLEMLVNGQRAQIKKDLKSLEPFQRLQILEKFMQYTLPKKKEISGSVGMNFESMTDEQLEAITNHLTRDV